MRYAQNDTFLLLISYCAHPNVQSRNLSAEISLSSSGGEGLSSIDFCVPSIKQLVNLQ